jgi:Glucanosyltransferase
MEQSGYDRRVQELSNFSVPVFLAEYGCSSPSPRQFGEVQAIYGPLLENGFSGGAVYQYFQDDSNSGRYVGE